MSSNRTISITWSVEDVLSIRPNLTEEQAMKVLQHVKDKHDATIGINWEVIITTADMLFND